jgi:hypothetical protein
VNKVVQKHWNCGPILLLSRTVHPETAGLPRLIRFPNPTVTTAMHARVPTLLSSSAAATPTVNKALPMDTTINIAFGVFMAGLGLITIYQAARLAALQTRRRRLNLMLLRFPISFSSLLTIEL